VSGQLGDGTKTDRAMTVAVPNLANVVMMAAGGYHSLALLGDGTVRGWGSNGVGQLGDGTTTGKLTPVQVAGLAGVTALSVGGSHNLALKADGTVWAWGWAEDGQLGDGTTGDPNCGCHKAPLQVPGLGGVIAVSAGHRHSLALKGDGTVWAWGNNEYGQLVRSVIVN
jgi:alpha-tubulin suppressor-like RCC1 family protein